MSGFDEASTETLIGIWRKGDHNQRIEAANKLGERKSTEAVSALIEGLKDQHAGTAIAAAQALAAIGDPVALDPLRAAYNELKVEVNRPNLHWIENRYSGISTALVTFLNNASLMEWLTTGDEADKSLAAVSLAQRNVRESISILKTLLNDPSQRVRKSVTWSLSQLGEPQPQL